MSDPNEVMKLCDQLEQLASNPRLCAPEAVIDIAHACIELRALLAKDAELERVKAEAGRWRTRVEEMVISKYVAERDTPEEMEMYQCSFCAGEWPAEMGPLHRDGCPFLNDGALPAHAAGELSKEG